MAITSIRGTAKAHALSTPTVKKAKSSSKTAALLENMPKLTLHSNVAVTATKTSASELVKAVLANDFHLIKSILQKACEQGENSELLVSQAYTEASLNKQAKAGPPLLKKAYLQLLVKQALQKQDSQLLTSSLAKFWEIEEAPLKLFTESLIECNSPLANRIASELEAIAGVPFERHKLRAFDMFVLCLASESALAKTQAKTQLLFLRKKTEKLPRSVVIDTSNRTFTILSKKQGALKAEGAFKRVTDAVEINLNGKNAKARRIVRLVSKAYEEISDRELGFEKRYGNVINSMRYQSLKRPAETKTQIFQEAYDHDLYIFTGYTPIERRKKLPFAELIQILLDIGQTLAKMHGDGHVHRDFKTKNVLYRKVNGKAEAKLIDFGHCYRPHDPYTYEKKRKKGYGTLRYTAVDVLEHPQLKKDIALLAKAEDMYALGTFIYELHFQKETPWGSEVYKALKRADEDRKHRDKAIRLQRETFEALSTSAQERGDFGYQDELVWIASRLLDPNPYNRMRIGEFTNAIQDLKARATQTT